MKEKLITKACGFCNEQFSRMLKVKYFPNDGDWGFSHAFNNLCNDCLRHYVEEGQYLTCSCGTIYREQSHTLNKECSDVVTLKYGYKCLDCTKKESEKEKKSWF